MAFKFEKLEVWQLALDYVDLAYDLTENLPKTEEYNLKTQFRRAATSVALNIAEGSIGQTNAEQARFIGYAIRSLVETVACQHIINRRNLIEDKELLRQAYRNAEKLVAKLHTFRKTLDPEQRWLREQDETYTTKTNPGT